MADWKQIPDTDVDPDAPVTSELMHALRDNPVAIAEGAVGAPYLHSAWVPWNGGNVGGSNDGLFYDSAVSGAADIIETPPFEDGVSYLFTSRSLQVEGSGGTIRPASQILVSFTDDFSRWSNEFIITREIQTWESASAGTKNEIYFPGSNLMGTPSLSYVRGIRYPWSSSGWGGAPAAMEPITICTAPPSGLNWTGTIGARLRVKLGSTYFQFRGKLFLYKRLNYMGGIYA